MKSFDVNKRLPQIEFSFFTTKIYEKVSKNKTKSLSIFIIEMNATQFRRQKSK
jgi:hypothetical protein